MHIEKTKAFYQQLESGELCDCVYCQNYIREIKSAYPEAAEFLSQLGVNIEKPFEVMLPESDEADTVVYPCVQYIIYGTPDDFTETTIGSVHIGIAGPHPSTAIKEEHFVIEIAPIRLKWVMQTN